MSACGTVDQGGTHTMQNGDSPVRLECSMWSRIEAGDHIIMVGAVDEVSRSVDPRPAIYFDRKFIDARL
ncbi:flavin reductase family protein [Nocardia rhizosphaerae]|uniref:Flavin reductase family protein n=1 Tax=Nocardia rhizosphaerae TaxID=1691571 RepID=A0ABV8L8X4_9NOCA